MANQYYENFVLQNEVNDMYATKLNHSDFCTVDTTLKGQAGDIVKVNVYDATDGAEVVEMGKGNTKVIEATLTSKDYTVKTVQNTAKWYDEEERRDPMIPVVLSQKAGIDLYNQEQKDIMAEYAKATQKVTLTGTDYFSAFVDAQAMITSPEQETTEPGNGTFAFLSKADLAKARKALRDDLKYVEAFARTGYVGTVAGTNLYVSNLATEGSIVLATKEAVKLFTKSDIEQEVFRKNNRSSEDADIRKNTIISRTIYIAALYDVRKAVIIGAGA